MNSDDTIFALASGQGRSAVAVIRISGGKTRDILSSVAGGVPREARRMMLRTLVEPSTGERLDQALVVWMPGPSSFTGEDQAELHIHGGAAVRTAVVGALLTMDGCRGAEPGEFTRRAFLNGKMDLSAVEGLADLIDAETQGQRRQAMRQLDGHLGQRVEGWRERTISALALLEAALDFSDEGDVPETLEQQALSSITALRAEIVASLDDGRRGERLREGFTVVLAGPPNAGKSTLLNALARRDVAIVSPSPGTTRDAIEVRLELDGLPVTIVDTAGLRKTTDLVEGQGVARARGRMEAADLVLWLEASDRGASKNGEAAPECHDVAILKVATKIDLKGSVITGVDVRVSALNGLGMAQLLDRITVEAQKSIAGEAVVTRARHRQALGDVIQSLIRASESLQAARPELAAEDVRLAVRAFGQITGRVDFDEVLDHVFSTFCIGK